MNHASSHQASVVKRSRSAKRFRRTSLSVALLGAFSGGAQALPQDGVVAAGTAAINQSGSTMTITQDSARAILDWQSFGIASGELVQFLQPSSSAVVLNRVLGNNASEIYGQLSANGQVFLTNPNGILFGAGAQVDVGGLVASTLGISNDDFLVGNYQFSGADGGVINNAGTINAQSLVALLAPEVRNDGLIVAQAVGIGASTAITLDLANGLKLEVTESALNAVIENRTAIRADGGTIILTATAQQALLGGMINNTGVLAASSLVDEGGRIMLMAGSVATTGLLDTSSTMAAGGKIGITGASVALGGNIRADGTDGGTIAVNSAGQLSLADHVSATGTDGAGGEVSYVAGGRLIENNGSLTDVSGSTDGGSISVQADRVFSSGTYVATGATGAGGRVDISAQQDVNLLSAQIDASGYTRGGLVRIGGAFQGGATPDADTPAPDLFLTRWADAPEIGSAQSVLVNDSAQIDVSSQQGVGGTAVIWSEQQTTWLGGIDATGAAGGGAVEISSANELRQAELLNVDIGAGGQLLLDPKNIVIGSASTTSSWVYSGIMGVGYSASTGTLESGDRFGSAVSLNAAGDRLAIGVAEDDGSGNALSQSGAVYLFGFDDANFGGGTLQAIVGKGYVGGNNVDVSALEATDIFGTGVSLNAVGDRLAVGAALDDGNGNALTDSGAVYLFSFNGANFSGGTLQATIGSGYSGGNNVDVGALEASDEFGISVSLNAAGDRLAVGSFLDDGSANIATDSGAVYLFSFADTNFSGGALEGVVGKGYTGGNNIDVGALEAVDGFGVSASLNALGDRLAVGAFQDDGAGNGTIQGGAVYLFSFADADFLSGTLSAMLGKGYTGGNNVDVSALEIGDRFGSAVSLNAVGDRLATGAYGDGGNGNVAAGSGAAYLFSFSDTNFSGGSLEATIGKGYTGGNNVDISALGAGDSFGSAGAISLNAAGDRLAVGAVGDQGSGDTLSYSGAVYLLSFSDTNFSGGTLQATIGSDYTGGNNIDVTNLGASSLDPGTLDAVDVSGSAVSLNAAGDRLAVGAYYDDGNGNALTDSGAVYLFGFSDTNFSGGTLQATIGSGYTGGNNVDLATLEAGDLFGVSVSLNAAGDRLAVGAFQDDGSGNVASDSGATYLFGFSDTSFSGGSLLATVGKGYTGGNNVDLAALEAGDYSGYAVSLNATGDRLAIGAIQDDGSANAVADSGAAYLFSFSDASFSGGTLQATIGSGYTGGNNIDLTALDAGDYFGSALSLNATGDRLAAGAYRDDGNANAVANGGAAYLFGFSDASFSGGTLQATIGSGYTGGNNVDLAALEAGDLFGRALSLNATGDRLAVGALGDDGAGNAAADSGAVYLLGFSDTSFSGGTLQATIGNGYIGSNDLDLAMLEGGDVFGSAVSLNAAGDRLAVGAYQDDGSSNSVTDSGAVYLFREMYAAGASDPVAVGNAYGTYSGLDAFITADSIAAQLNAGTAVTLQASNDITVNNAVIANNASGDGGNFTLQAGRSILLNAGISTDNGDLTLIANDLLANGVIDADRDAGAAVITTTGQAIDAGTGTVTIDLRSGAGKTNSTSGDINLGAISAGTILVTNHGVTAGSDVIVNGALAATGTGNALTLAGDNVTNSGGGLAANNGRWLVYVTDTLASDPFASFAYDFKQYNATYGVSTVLGSGNGFLLVQAPTITASLTGTVSKEYDATTAATLAAGNYALSGVVQGDTVTINNPASGTYDNKNVGTGKTVSVTGVAISSTDNGGRTVYGYQLASSSINGAVGTVTAKAIDATGITASDKTYDATVAALLNVGSAGLSGAILGDTVSLDVGTAAGAFDTKNVGLNKTVTVSGLALAGTDAGNYTLNAGYTTTADINALALDVTGITAADKVYNATTVATLDTTAANISGVLGSEAVTLDATAATGAFDTKNVGLAKTVTVSSLALTGADAGNYTLSTYTTTADISALAIDASGITAGDKVYDATIAATLDTTAAALSGAILGDIVSLDVTSATGAFDTKNVGLAKTVTVNSLALAGTDAGNYSLNAYTTTADISALAIDASGITAVDKVYDATTAATLDTTAAGLAGAILGDTVSIDVTTATGAFANKNVGLNKTVTVSGLALSGTDAGNYTLNAGYTTTADISALAINATGITADDKMYDGRPTAALDTTAAGLAGVLGGDTVSLDVTGATGAFSDDIAGRNKTVTVSGLLLAGLDAGNYLLNPYTTTADIGLVFSLEQSGVEIHRYTNEEADGWRRRAVTLGDVPATAIDRCGIRTGLSGAGRPPCDKD